MRMSRTWAMPSADTFDIPQIQGFVKSYLTGISIDPFARNSRIATYTNDLNPDTLAQHHMDVFDYLNMLLDKQIKADVIIFDPPYSPRQIKECYDGIGLKMKSEDAWRSAGWMKERDIADRLLKIGGIVLSFGFNSCGMGKDRGYEIIEILLVSHGATHNDTICMAERKLQGNLL